MKSSLLFPFLFIASMALSQSCPKDVSVSAPLTASSEGIMFRIHANRSMNIDTIHLPLEAADFYLNVLYKSGNHDSGSSTNPQEWTVYGRLPVMNMFGADSYLLVNFYLEAGCDLSLYISTDPSGLGGIRICPFAIIGIQENQTGLDCNIYTGVSKGLPLFSPDLTPFFGQIWVKYDTCSNSGASVCFPTSIKVPASNAECKVLGSNIKVFSSDKWDLSVVDMQGQVVLHQIGFGDSNFSLDFLPTGAYVWTLLDEQGKSSKKFGILK